MPDPPRTTNHITSLPPSLSPSPSLSQLPLFLSLSHARSLSSLSLSPLPLSLPPSLPLSLLDQQTRFCPLPSSLRERNRRREFYPDQFEIHLCGAIFWPHGRLLATEGMPHLPIRVFKIRREACSIAQGRREHPRAHPSLVRCFTCSVAFPPPSPACPTHARNRDHNTRAAERSSAPHNISSDMARPLAQLLPAASAISLQRRLPLTR